MADEQKGYFINNEDLRIANRFVKFCKTRPLLNQDNVFIKNQLAKRQWKSTFHSGRIPAIPCAGFLDINREEDQPDAFEPWFSDSTDRSDTESDNQPKKIKEEPNK